MKNKTFKRSIAIVLCLAILAAIGIGAYLTDTEVKKDVYTVGNVQAEIVANGDMELDNVGALLPGTIHRYERAATNTGINDAYVFMSLTIPYEMVGAADNNGSQIGERVRQLFIPGSADGGFIGSEWKLVDVGHIGQYEIEDNGQYCGEHDQYSVVVGDAITYVYGYIGDNADGSLKVLSAGETTSNLVDTMELTNLYSIGKINGSISTKLYAIQSDNVNGGLTDVNGVWAVINKALCGDGNIAATLTYNITNTRTSDAVGYAPLRLVNENGETVATSVANEEGNGQFSNIPAGNYTIETDVGDLSVNNTASTFRMRRFAAPRSASVEITGEDGYVNLGLTTVPNTLVQGPIFNTYIPDNVTSVEFVAMPQTYGLADRTLPADAFDVSEAADGSIMAWVEDTTMYVVAINGEKIYANPNCNGMFEYKYSLSHIGTENLDTINVVSGYRMFISCNSLDNNIKEFDFSNMRGFESAFSDCSWITEYTIPDGVEVIPYGAFMGCDSLTSITLPTGITKIEDNAFGSCGFTSFNIPDTVEYIGGYAFAYCNKLVSITIPASVTEIAEMAFNGCEGLTSIMFAEGVENIPSRAFMDCYNLTEIVIPSTVKLIGENAFYGAQQLSEINIPSSVETIEGGAFSNMAALTNINVDPTNEHYTSIDGVLYSKDMKTLVQYPSGQGAATYSIKDGVEAIGARAFSDYKTLTSIVVPASVKEIDNYAFSGCSNLTTITFNENSSLKSIGNYAFYYCSKLSSVIIPASVELISDNAFRSCSKLASVSLANNSNLIEIGSYAFSGTIITSVNIPASVEIIGEAAFSCGKLETVNFANDTKLKSVGHNAFNGSKWLANQKTNGQILTINGVLISGSTASGKVIIPEGTTVIPQYFFRDNLAITSVVIPNSVIEIDRYAFFGCDNLTSVTIPASVEIIDDGAFYSCDNLSTVTFEKDSNLKRIGTQAFETCPKLTSINLPEGLETISSAFYGSGIKTITIPSTFAVVDPMVIKSVFRGASSLTEIIVADNNPYYTSVDGVLFTKDMKTLVFYPAGKTDTHYVVPEGVEIIGYNAFYNCSKLVSITLSSDIETIYNGAFMSCNNLTTITIPVSIRNIYMAAISNNKNFTTINYCGTQSQWNKVWFDNNWIDGYLGQPINYVVNYNYIIPN